MGAVWQNIGMETASFRNWAELLSQVLAQPIVSAGSLQPFLLRGLCLPLPGPKRGDKQSLKMTVLTFPHFIPFPYFPPALFKGN